MAAAGVLVAALGVVVTTQAQDHFDQYDAEVAAYCRTRPCVESDLPSSTRDLKDRGERENLAAVTMYGVGGVLLPLAGIKLLDVLLVALGLA